MAENEKKPETPTSDVLITLQNRINDLEAKLQQAEKDRASRLWVEPAFFDTKIAELKEEIAELRKERKAVKKEEGALKKEDKEDAEGSKIGDDWDPVKSISL